MLIAQPYSLVDDEAHLRALLPNFQNSRYIRIHNNPFFLVYRASRLPDPRATPALWRRLAQQHGLNSLYLVKVESFPTERNRHPELDGFVAALNFQPDWGTLPPHLQPPFRWKLLNKLGLARTPLPLRHPPPDAKPPAEASVVPQSSTAQPPPPSASGFVLRWQIRKPWANCQGRLCSLMHGKNGLRGIILNLI